MEWSLTTAMRYDVIGDFDVAGLLGDPSNPTIRPAVRASTRFAP